MINAFAVNKRRNIAIAACMIIFIIGLTADICIVHGIKFVITLGVLLIFQLGMSIYDVISLRISLKIVIAAFLVGCGILTGTGRIIVGAAGAIVAYAIMKVLVIASRRQIGGGDLLLMTVTGFFLGPISFLRVLFLSVPLSGIYSLFIFFTGRGNKRSEIPFAPFVLVGTVFLVLFESPF